MNKLFSKKAQITLFVIIGIVILVSAGLIIYITSRGIDSKLDNKDNTAKDDVYLYVEQCITMVGNEALEKAGYNGGYIYPRENYDENLIDVAKLSPTSVDFLLLHDRLPLPYWYYQNNGVDELNYPDLDKKYEDDYSIQDQVEKYVDENILICINNFKPYSDKNIKVKIKKKPTTTVTFTDSNTAIKVDMDVEFDKDGKISKYETFSTSLPVRMRAVYSLAKDIVDYEEQSWFLDRATMNFITLYSRVDSNYLPPTYGGMEMTDCGDRTMWFEENVKEDFSEMLSANVGYLRVANTDYTPVKITPADEPDADNRKLRQAVFDNLAHNVSDKPYPFIRASFNYYDDFPLELNFGKNKGVLEPASFEINFVLAKMCMLEYEFSYNVNHPVLVTLVDEKSFINGNNFVFQFPIEVIIKNNHPRIQNPKTVGLEMPESVSSHYCDNENRINDIKLNVIEDFSKRPVSDATIFYQCGPTYAGNENNGEAQTSFGEQCLIGKTDSNGRIEAKVPMCAGGAILQIKNKDYLSYSKLYKDVGVKGSENAKGIFSMITLRKLVEYEIDLKKYPVIPPNPTMNDLALKNDNPDIEVNKETEEVTKCTINKGLLDAKLEERAIIRFTPLDYDYGDFEFSPYVLYKKENATTVKLAPGISYNIDIMYILNERYEGEITFPSKSEMMKVKGGLFQSDKEVKYPDEDIIVPSAIVGGVNLNFTLDYIGEIKKNQKAVLEVYVFDEGRPTSLEQVSSPTGHIAGCSNLNVGLLTPVSYVASKE